VRPTYPVQISDLRNDEALRRMTYYAAVSWCADHEGRLRRDRLERVARARGLSAAWVMANAGNHIDEFRKSHARWQQQRRLRRR